MPAKFQYTNKLALKERRYRRRPQKRTQHAHSTQYVKRINKRVAFTPSSNKYKLLLLQSCNRRKFILIHLLAAGGKNYRQRHHESVIGWIILVNTHVGWVVLPSFHFMIIFCCCTFSFRFFFLLFIFFSFCCAPFHLCL